MGNEQHTEALLAGIDATVKSIDKKVDALVVDMKEGRNHRNNLDRRVTRLETKMDDIDTFKKSLIGRAAGIIGALAIIAAVIVILINYFL